MVTEQIRCSLKRTTEDTVQEHISHQIKENSKSSKILFHSQNFVFYLVTGSVGCVDHPKSTEPTTGC